MQEESREGELRHWLAPPDGEGGCIPKLRTVAGPPKAGRKGQGWESGSPCGLGQSAVTISDERIPYPLRYSLHPPLPGTAQASALRRERDAPSRMRPPVPQKREEAGAAKGPNLQ